MYMINTEQMKKRPRKEQGRKCKAKAMLMQYL